jgi:hypothetical protein
LLTEKAALLRRDKVPTSGVTQHAKMFLRADAYCGMAFLPGDVIDRESSDCRNRSDIWLRAGSPPQKSYIGRRSSIE